LEKDEVAFLQNDGACILATEAMMAMRDLASNHMHKDRIVKIDRSRKTVIVYSKLVLCLGAWTNKLLRDSVLRELPNVTSLEQFVYYDLKPGQHETDFTIILEGKKYSNGRLDGVYAMPPHIEDGVPGV